GTVAAQLGRLRRREAVAPADERVALDHRRQRRMHATRAEGDHLPLTRRLLAARRLRGDTGRLAQEAEQRRLVLRPLDVRALDAEDGLVGLEDRAVVTRPPLH